MVQPNIIQDRLQELFPVHYRNGNILMINADCMDVMKHIKDKEVELSCVDPPYGINIAKEKPRVSGRWNYKPGKWDELPPPPEYFEQLFRVSKNQIIWGGNYFLLPPSRCWIIWDKKQSVDNFADGEMAWTNFDEVVSFFRFSFSANRYKIHITQKPVALYKWLLSRYAKPGDRILDTHGGSGSICIACHDLGYDLTWMELDEDYYEAACARYKLHASQAQLFEPNNTPVIKDQDFTF